MELIEVEAKYRGWCRILVAKLKLASGKIVPREIEDHGNAAGILPYDPVRRTAIVIRQTRAPLLYSAKARVIEVIAGMIDPGEEPAETARREAVEEAGLRVNAIEHVTTAWTMPGLSTERMALFLAQYSEADRVGPGGGIDDEDIEVLEIGLNQLAAMINRGESIDLKAFTLIQTLRLRRPELFTPA